MTAAARTDPRNFIRDLTRSPSGRLLQNALENRWSATPDRLSTIVRYALLPAGKMLRPIMTLESAAAVGGDPDPVLPAALAMEYLHVATLVHDDIIDADEVRRGRPAVPTAFGLPDAIVTGDHLIFCAFASMVECGSGGVPADRIASAVAALAAAGNDLCRGQMLESELVDDPDTGVERYLEMVRLKTGALFRAVCHVGAALGGADEERSAQLAGYGEQLGIAFQIRDDLLSYTAVAQSIGKSTTSDLSNGRPTLPVLLAHQAGTPQVRDRLTAALRGHRADPATVGEVQRILAETAALDRTRECLVDHAGQARDRLTGLPPSTSTALLDSVARWAAAHRW
ncbi:polyprenyl synthetase family protein [Micromonospora sp. CPCC 206060]|uniref:polyprenyl synthetase family protein n=1 Tax=Micromonospora sp. CPCC 206060 TaxID=3122406 RepID=UPI002FF2D6EB